MLTLSNILYRRDGKTLFDIPAADLSGGQITGL